MYTGQTHIPPIVILIMQEFDELQFESIQDKITLDANGKSGSKRSESGKIDRSVKVIIFKEKFRV